jgi:PAS domain S-box-containing protein
VSPVGTIETRRQDAGRRRESPVKLRRYRSISTLLLALVMACMAPLALIFGLSTFLDTAQDLDRREASLHALAQAHANEVGRQIAVVRLVTRELARRPLVRRLDEKHCDPMLSVFRTMFPDIGNISTLAPDGRVVCSTLTSVDTAAVKPSGPVSFATADWFVGARSAGRFSVSGLMPESGSGLPVTMITAPLDEDAAPGAMIAVSLRLAGSEPGRTADPLPPRSQSGIIRADGRLVWHSTRIAATRQEPSAVPPLRELLAIGNGTARATSADGEQRIFGVAPVPESELFAYIGIPINAVYAEDLRSALLSVLLGIITLLLVGGLALVVARRIADPIGSLALAADDLRRGRLDTRAPVYGTNETVAVGETFNRLVDEWQSAQGLLAQSMKDYEDLYQNAPCGYHSVNMDGAFIRVNDTELRWLGYERDEIVGRKNIRDLVAPENRSDFESAFAAMIETGRMADFSADYLCKDGSRLPVLITASAIRDADGNFVMSRSIVHNMSELRRFENDRAEDARHIQFLSHQLVAAQEEERRRLSSELHDRTSANLAALGADLAALAERMPQPPSEAVSDLLADTQAVLEDTGRSLREICAELRPPVLDYAGLMPALESYARQFEKRLGIAVSLKGPTTAPRLAAEVESTLYRIAQEALTNCAKHASATAVEIQLILGDEGNRFTIEDNGIGFDAAGIRSKDAATGLGLLSMRQRAEFIGGRLSIDSAPDRGTRVVIQF